MTCSTWIHLYWMVITKSLASAPGPSKEGELIQLFLQSRLDQYNKKREHGWTVEDTTTAQVVVKTASKSLEDETDEVLETPQESYNSDPQAQDIALLQSSEWNNGEEVSTDTETASSTGSFAIVVMVGVAIIAAVGLVLVVKRRALGNDQQFKPVFGGDNTLPSVV